MILGLRTALYAAPDLQEGRRWYSQVLEREPYFNEPFYVGFSVGGFELGLVPDLAPGAGGTRALWGVPDLAVELERLMQLGATLHEPLTDVGEGIKVASIIDPFGNIFGIIENPNFDTRHLR